jgi:hypothetical protein
MTRLITFATQEMTIAAEYCNASAALNNVDQIRVYGPSDIDEKFFEANKEIFNQPRGYGYWLWKPYLINRELNRMSERDVLIYSDAGVELVNNVNHIIDRMGDQNVFLFGNMWKHLHWCKMDAIESILSRVFRQDFIQMMKGIEDVNQVQASVIFIRNTEYSRRFVKEWLHWCTVKQLIDDSPSVAPNHPEFREHRHDQAILTCLAYREGIKLHWWPAMYNAGNFTYEKTGYNDDYPVLFHHHRMRNDEFSATDDLNRHMQNYFKRKYQIAA